MHKTKSFHRTTIWHRCRAAKFQPMRGKHRFVYRYLLLCEPFLVSLREALGIRRKPTSMDTTASNEIEAPATDSEAQEQNFLLDDKEIDEPYDTIDSHSSSDQSDDGEMDKEQHVDEDISGFSS